MSVSALNHFTIRCTPDELPALHRFYTKYLHLTRGPRPIMSFDGYWLYSNGQPVVHLAAFLNGKEAATTGPVDHISFRAHGLEETRSFLKAEGVPFDEAPVPDWPIHQLFMRDPSGLKIELTFDLNEERAGGNG